MPGGLSDEDWSWVGRLVLVGPGSGWVGTWVGKPDPGRKRRAEARDTGPTGRAGSLLTPCLHRTLWLRLFLSIVDSAHFLFVVKS